MADTYSHIPPILVIDIPALARDEIMISSYIIHSELNLRCPIAS